MIAKVSKEQQTLPETRVNSSDRPIRPIVKGKFIFVGEEKLWVRGVTYGAFEPDEDEQEYQDRDKLNRDFALMAKNEINTVRIPHTMPPRHLLDIAHQHNLWVMVGLSAEQYIGYLIDRKDAPNVKELIRAKVREVAGHPALLCYGLGNEIQPSLARWLGHRRVERYLEELYWTVKAEDPEGIVTYVNYPTTEYLQLPFLDLVCFNVYLEAQDRLAAYLARLQNIAGDRPLIMSEVGLDALRNGEETQADVLDWQIRTAFAAGCVGCFIFSWTDEWYRGGAHVDDWAFGITTQQRQPKPALAKVKQAFQDVPFAAVLDWPRISVVVCSYNGAGTIRDTLEALQKLDYPNYEVIVVNDGSEDATAQIVQEYDFQLISTENRGLSSARNTGMKAATGEIVAYIDDDAYPDPDWLTFLAHAFKNTDYGGIGGPNLVPPDDGWVATCVAHSPGGPMPVLVSDCEAEHIAGCNMAFRKACLEAIEGFDPRFRVAGDDVDVCWRLQEQGWTLGYSPAALVWHHRRNSIATYWKQQKGYGKAEALLEKKWPQKYNLAGHLDWQGRVYGSGLIWTLPFTRLRIYHGVWGSEPFQSLHEMPPNLLIALSLMPEWYFISCFLMGLSALGLLWPPLLFALIPLIPALCLPIIHAVWNTYHAFPHLPQFQAEGLKFRGLTVFLHLMQPLARLFGRLCHGLTPWRRRSPFLFKFPKPQSHKIWSEQWQAPEERLACLEAAFREQGLFVQRGGVYDAWDLKVRRGLWGGLKILMAVEDHGSGTQLVRLRARPQIFLWPSAIFLCFLVLDILALVDQAWSVSSILGLLTFVVGWQIFRYCSAAMAYYHQAVQTVVR